MRCAATKSPAVRGRCSEQNAHPSRRRAGGPRGQQLGQYLRQDARSPPQESMALFVEVFSSSVSVSGWRELAVLARCGVAERDRDPCVCPWNGIGSDRRGRNNRIDESDCCQTPRSDNLPDEHTWEAADVWSVSWLTRVIQQSPRTSSTQLCGRSSTLWHRRVVYQAAAQPTARSNRGRKMQ